ncbi:carbon-nitrogen hydrolase family protein [Candidatus Poribacteria bacterium]|nr:carbon-nitrogen hydrolase family protein [Candidatus Poribacteria bacterium]
MPRDGIELVVNGGFQGGGHQEGADALPDGWRVWTPEWQRASCNVSWTPAGLRVAPDGTPWSVGGVFQSIHGVGAGEAYAVKAELSVSGVNDPERSIILRVAWTKDGRRLNHGGDLARGPILHGGDARFEGTVVAPADADGAELSLDHKWLGEGSVTWRSVSMLPADAPAPRMVRIGTSYLRPRNSDKVKNLELFCQLVDAAGADRVDILCLSEAITMVGTSHGFAGSAEPIPGPSTQALGEAARRNRMWVVAGLLEAVGDVLYNTAVLLDRDGELAGTYRKVHLPRDEWRQGITPGDSYPVFRTDFGVVAMQICYDWFFPEPHAIFTLQGAEVILAPTWGTTFRDEDGRVEGETVFRVRARDNGVVMVPAVYDGSSMVIDQVGRIVATNDGKEGVFWADVDLDARERLPWVGRWRATGRHDRMPETYSVLTQSHLAFEPGS